MIVHEAEVVFRIGVAVFRSPPVAV
jgi:hypothetical protein